MAIAAIPPRRKYAQVIEPEETAQQFTSTDKMMFSFGEVARPITLLPALYSASYEQLFDLDPKYGRPWITLQCGPGRASINLSSDVSRRKILQFAKSTCPLLALVS
jgi:hypothetical protein